MILRAEQPTSIKELADLLDAKLVNLENDLLIKSACDSSSDVSENSIFIAVKGTSFDSHTVVSNAVDNGAIAALVADETYLNGLPGIVVENTRLAKSKIASILTGAPEKKLKILGITGTNGKSSTCWITANLLNFSGTKTLSIGTLGVKGPGVEKELALTTPDSFELHDLFRDALKQGIQTVVMESSAHALTQYRVESVPYTGAVFSNLTHDHLDYFSDENSYFNAKQHLFDLLASNGSAYINIDDKWGELLFEKLDCKNKKSISTNKSADLNFTILGADATGTHIELKVKNQSIKFKSPLIAEHNAYNLISSLALCTSIGLDLENLVEFLDDIPQIPGRLELATESPSTFVDYAHTPDALKHALVSLRKISPNKLWVVFGCGGDRDAKKRPVMGKLASELADFVVITSDNPRSEKPLEIIEQIKKGTTREVLVEPDRADAIRYAIKNADADDVILIAGKGHENYQIIGDKKNDFSDVNHAKQSFKEVR